MKKFPKFHPELNFINKTHQTTYKLHQDHDIYLILGNAGGYAFNLHPDITTLGTAYLDLLEAYQWKSITILYQDNDSMIRGVPNAKKSGMN